MPSLDLLSSVYLSDSSDLYRKLVIQDQSVDQLFGYFPDQKDPGMLLIAARLTDASHAADVRDAINTTLVEARTQLVNAKKVEETKSRLRYGFTAQLDNSGAIGGNLASFVQFFRTPETINEVYATYETVTAEDIRDVAHDIGRRTRCRCRNGGCERYSCGTNRRCSAYRSARCRCDTSLVYQQAICLVPIS
jgi:zinc protease